MKPLFLLKLLVRKNILRKLFTKHKIEVKQMTALVISKCGLGIAEGPTVPQIVQEEKFMENFTKVLEMLR
jgi:hypothetical protein